MSNTGGPRWAKDIITVTLWSASAVNVFIYTYRSAIEMWKRPPLTAWTNGGGSLPQIKNNLNEAFNPPKQQSSGSKKKSENFPEALKKESTVPVTPLTPPGTQGLAEKVLKIFGIG